MKFVKNKLQKAVAFDPIPTNLPADLPPHLLENSDQKYLFKIVMAISNGHLDPSLQDPNFINQSHLVAHTSVV